MSSPVGWWHALLGAIALLNLNLWSLSAAAVMRQQSLMHASTLAACHVQLLLCALYVLGCAFRSVLPVFDVPRIVLVDSRLSSVVVGRSVATVAEMAFAAQWALVLHRMAELSHSPFVDAVALAIVPLVTVAEICSWHAVLTTEQRGHIAENSLWGLCAVLLVVSLSVVGPHRIPGVYWPVIVWSFGAGAYAAFIFVFDVPMYWTRWLADRASGRRYLTVVQGIRDAWMRRVVSYRLEDWKNEMVWMTLYFSFGVWSSVSLVFAAIILGAHGN